MQNDPNSDKTWNGPVFVSTPLLSHKFGIPWIFYGEFVPRSSPTKKLEAISVLELSECAFRKALCPNRKTCVLRWRIRTVEEKVKREFQAITIQNLIDDILEQQ